MRTRIYTDGSFQKGVGGWAFAAYTQSRIERSSGGLCEASSSNGVELRAIVEALKYCVEAGLYDLEILSDSAYCINNMQYKIPQRWEKNDWKTQLGVEIKNMELWKSYLECINSLEEHKAVVRFTKIKGHVGNTFNEIADAYARQACVQNNE